MRTTITLPDELHHQVTSIARDRRTTVSRAVESLLRQALAGPGIASDRLVRDPRTGFLVLHLDRPITAEDVRSLEDDV